MPRLSCLALGLLSLALAAGTPVRAEKVQGGDAHAAAPGGHGADPAADAHAPGHSGGDAAHGEQPNILQPQPNLAIFTLIVFVLLLAILWKFAWGPLAAALEARERHQIEVLERAEAARRESEALLAQHREQMARVTEQVQAIIAEARRDADAAARQITEQAQAEAEATRKRATGEIAAARDAALVEIWGKTADLAVSVAGKVLERELGPDDQRRLAESALAALPASPNGHGGHHS